MGYNAWCVKGFREDSPIIPRSAKLSAMTYQRYEHACIARPLTDEQMDLVMRDGSRCPHCGERIAEMTERCPVREVWWPGDENVVKTCCLPAGHDGPHMQDWRPWGGLEPWLDREMEEREP